MNRLKGTAGSQVSSEDVSRPREVTWDTSWAGDGSGQARGAGRPESSDSRSASLRIVIVTSAFRPWPAHN